MSDLASAEDISGSVDLYDIDYEAAAHNEIIGNRFNGAKGAKTHWTYHARETIKEALTGADFVVISILPGTFDEMESDVHTPEKYGIYQSVGDTTGPGGIIRALRTIPGCLWRFLPDFLSPEPLSSRTQQPHAAALGHCCHPPVPTSVPTPIPRLLRDSGERPLRI